MVGVVVDYALLWSGGWKEALRLVEPAHHLTQENISDLAHSMFVVGPKVEGERALLISDPSNSDVFLLKMNGLVSKVEGARTGSLRGFILDVEVVNGPGASHSFLSFDVLALEPRMDLSMHGLTFKWKGFDSQSASRLSKQVTYLERREIFSAIVDSMTMPRLLVKPIFDAADAHTIWVNAQKLPYPVDGLVFTRCCYDSTNEGDSTTNLNYKWKPPEKITLDVALGKVIMKKEKRSLFRAHLLRYEHVYIPQERDLMFWESPVVAPGEHAPFHFNFENGYDLKEVEADPDEWISYNHLSTIPREFDYSYADDDIAYAEIQDRLLIKKGRAEEAPLHLLEDQTCHIEDCPCGDQYASGRKLIHCSLCRALVVANRTDAKCSCLQCTTQEIWVPDPYRDWATFHIVEADFDLGENGQPVLKFKRLRRDKRAANSIGTANEIYSAKMLPIGFDKLTALLELRGDHSSKCSIYPVQSCREKTSSSERSSFTFIRHMHTKIKRWLYETFGGTRIVDACVGGLHDMHDWNASGCQCVLALERDGERIQMGKECISKRYSSASGFLNALPLGCDDGLIQEGQDRVTRNSPAKNVQVELIKANLSYPLEEGIGSQFKKKSAAVFCNFGLHYFWGSSQDTHQFLFDLVPFLSRGGFFVATAMRADIFGSSHRVHVLNDNGEKEIEAIKNDDGTADVFVASIGKRAMSKKELEMSSLFRAYIFVKKSNQGPINDLQSSLFSFPEGVELEILLYLRVDELVSKIRGLSHAARKRVDTLRIPDSSWCPGFQRKEIHISDLRENPDRWPSASLGLFLSIGGQIEAGKGGATDLNRDDARGLSRGDVMGLNSFADHSEYYYHESDSQDYYENFAYYSRVANNDHDHFQVRFW